MKTIISLIIIVLYCMLCSCYTKKEAIEKFCNQDTIQTTIVIHDTIIVDSVQVDTVFNDRIDSVFIQKDKIQIQYIKKFGKIYLQGKCIGDTIYYEKKVIVEVPVNCPEPSNFDKIFLQAKWWIIIIFAILILVIFKL